MMAILLLLKGCILLLYIRFFWIVHNHRKQDPTLKFSVDFISVIEVATTTAISIICLCSSLSTGTIFIIALALFECVILYYEGKRVILIGEKTIQIREKLLYINQIKMVRTSLWSLQVGSKDQMIKVMNPLVVGWKFQEKVYQKIGKKCA